MTIGGRSGSFRWLVPRAVGDVLREQVAEERRQAHGARARLRLGRTLDQLAADLGEALGDRELPAQVEVADAEGPASPIRSPRVPRSPRRSDR